MDRHFVALLLLAGGLGFAFGGCLGAQLTISAYSQQDRQRALERRMLNEIWRMLREEFGIDKAPWMAEVLDLDRRKKHSPIRRVKERRRLLP